MNLSDKMKSEAIGLGLCAQWTAEWEDNSSKDAMVEKFVTGIDFCIRHNWPSVEVIKGKAGDVIHKHGVYADEAVHLYNPHGIVVLNGACYGNAVFDGFTVATIYIRHTTCFRVTVGGMAKVRICLYDNANADVECVGNGNCSVYRYGGSVSRNVGAKEFDRTEWFCKYTNKS